MDLKPNPAAPLSDNQQFLDDPIGLTAIFSSFLFSPPKYARKVIYNSDCRRCPISGTKTDQVDIDREGLLFTASEANDGSYSDNINRKGGST
jgi:hypothetical protein